MTLLATVVAGLMAGSASETPAVVVQAADSPVKIERATILTTGDAPPIVLYSATNQTDGELDQFTVIVFVFDAQGTLKARQTAPARRSLEAHSTKFSAMVIDGSPIGPTDQVVIGVNQAQRVNSDAWWRGDIQPAAEAAARKKNR
jgi:chaperonin GroEL (HSP60 family)